MKPPRFQYLAPRELSEALELLATHAEDAKVLAGGQSLIPILSMRLVRPSHVIDINRISALDFVRREGDVLRVGALTRHDTLLTSDVVGDACPLITAAMPYVGHLAIRYRGTIGGSIAHADPSAELCAVATALDADLVLSSVRGTRTVPASEFFLSYFMTSAEPDEMLTEIVFPVQATGSRSAVQEMARRHGDFALTGVVMAIETDGAGTVNAARLCAFGVDEVPRRLDQAERILTGRVPDEAVLGEVAAAAMESIEPESDMHASADYRREMTGVLLRRGLAQALDSQQPAMA